MVICEQAGLSPSVRKRCRLCRHLVVGPMREETNAFSRRLPLQRAGASLGAFKSSVRIWGVSKLFRYTIVPNHTTTGIRDIIKCFWCIWCIYSRPCSRPFKMITTMVMCSIVSSSHMWTWGGFRYTRYTRIFWTRSMTVFLVGVSKLTRYTRYTLRSCKLI